MDWQQFFNNFGVVAGFCAFILFWLSIVFWLMTDAQKRGLWGWIWAFVGLLTGPIGLIGYIIFWRGRYSVLPVVAERNALIEQTNRTRRPADLPDPESSPAIPETQDELTEAPSPRTPIPRQYQ